MLDFREATIYLFEKVKTQMPSRYAKRPDGWEKFVVQI